MKLLPPKVPCKKCGRPTRAKIGICFRTPECRNAYYQATYVPKPRKPRRAKGARQRPGRRGCERCGKPTRSEVGVCRTNAECNRLYFQRHYEAGQTAVVTVPSSTPDRDCPNCLAKEQFFQREIRRLERLLEAAGINPLTAKVCPPERNSHAHAR